MVDKISPQAQIIANMPNVCSKYLSSPLVTSEKKNDTVELSYKKEASDKQENPEISDKKSKKVLIASLSLGAAGLVTILGVLTNTRGWNKKVAKILKENIKDGDEIFNLTKFKETIQASAKDKRVIKLSNFMNNMANFKDCYILPVLEKIPGLKQFAKKTSDIYKQTGVKMTQSAYKHANNSYGIFDSRVEKILDTVQDEEVIKSVQNLIQKRNAIIKEYFTPNSVQNISDGMEKGRIKTIEKIMDDVGNGKGICRTVRSKFNGMIKRALKSKGKDVDGFGNFIAEDLIKTQKENFISPLRRAKKDINELDRQILELLENSCGEEYLLKHSQNIAKSRSDAARALNNAIRTEANDLFDKMRDVKIGSAPTDILSMAGTAGLMGVYLAQAEDKNQRVEVALTTGVPLGLGMIATTFATMKMYTGIKSLAFGAITTFAANTIGKIINKQYQKANNVEHKEPEIPTLDKFAQDFNDKIKAPIS